MRGVRSVGVWLLSLLAFPSPGHCAFHPIPIPAECFNQDVIVERTAPPPLVPVTTASMDSGLLNDGYSWYERGYNDIWLATGLPAAGSVLTSDADFNHFYQFAPSYRSNNAVLIDSTLTTARLTPATPLPYAALSLLVSSGAGTGVIGYTIRFQDETSESGTVSCPYWFGVAGSAWSANGRVNVVTFTFDSLNTDNPKLFSRDIVITNTSSPILSIDLVYVSGPGHNMIFALSGASAAGEPFNPIAFSGYNVDAVVEASAIRQGYLNGVTTATMDNGTANTRSTIYERGYYPPAMNTGLPAAGSTVQSESAPDHFYLLPPDYALNNAVLLDLTSVEAVLPLTTPTNLAALSFLTASGHGPVTNTCVVEHLDATAGTNLWVAPDWFDPAPPALTLNGRVSISTRVVDRLDSGFPRLYSVDIPVGNSSSPVTNLILRFAGAGNDAHAVVLALSGSGGDGPPISPPRLSILLQPDGTLLITTTAPGRLQSTTALNGAQTVWLDEGPIAVSRTLSLDPGVPMKFYCVVSPRP